MWCIGVVCVCGCVSKEESVCVWCVLCVREREARARVWSDLQRARVWVCVWVCKKFPPRAAVLCVVCVWCVCVCVDGVCVLWCVWCVYVWVHSTRVWVCCVCVPLH